MSRGEHASIAVPVPVRRLFTYRVPNELAASIAPGVRVRVPFGPRRVEGTVVEWPADPPGVEVDVKAIEAVLDDAPSPCAEILELTRFVADYYLSSWGEAIEAALPPDPGGRRVTVVARTPAASADELPARATARRRLLEVLPGDGTAVPLSELGASERRAVPALRRLGWVDVSTRVRRGGEPVATQSAAPADPPLEPSAAQAAVLAEIRPALVSREFAPMLLYGATGSGKTEVYLQAAAATLADGRSVIYLVPEIGLTPLLLATLHRRFPGQAVVLHSALSKRERYEGWRMLRDGERRFVIGTRSAVFAPVRQLGLIIVDEEQDGSYKQEETPRYNARDLALVRARSAGAVVLLGSATPSMESFRHAKAGRYRMLRLGSRIDDRPLAEVQLVDMREEYRSAGEVNPVSARLISALRACVSRGEQALVLRNRRGWAAALLCPSCGDRISCANCSIALTWHRAERRLRCHYCGFVLGYPEQCPTCGGADLKLMGEGTERVEDTIREAVPGATIERMDRDTIRRRGAHERLLKRFDRGEIDILVGTQMIAKGHDFPQVTLVGVLSADQSLGLPDFRAGERTFQLLTQVAGRAGRGTKPGRVLVQAFQPQHPLLKQAATQDYEGFYERELGYRRAFRYPPFTALVRLVVHDRLEHRARDWAESVAATLRERGSERLLISGPGPAPIERLQGRFRQQILVRSAGRRRLVEAVADTLEAVQGTVPRRALVVDVDPLTLL